MTDKARRRQLAIAPAQEAYAKAIAQPWELRRQATMDAKAACDKEVADALVKYKAAVASGILQRAAADLDEVRVLAGVKCTQAISKADVEYETAVVPHRQKMMDEIAWVDQNLPG